MWGRKDNNGSFNWSWKSQGKAEPFETSEVLEVLSVATCNVEVERGEYLDVISIVETLDNVDCISLKKLVWAQRKMVLDTSQIDYTEVIYEMRSGRIYYRF